MTTAVELERSLETDLGLDVLALDELGELVLGSVETRDVRSVVLVVVEGHDLLRDGGLEGLWSKTGGHAHDTPRIRYVSSYSQIDLSLNLFTYIIRIREVGEGVLGTSSSKTTGSGHDGGTGERAKDRGHLGTACGAVECVF